MNNTLSGPLTVTALQFMPSAADVSASNGGVLYWTTGVPANLPSLATLATLGQPTWMVQPFNSLAASGLAMTIPGKSSIIVVLSITTGAGVTRWGAVPGPLAPLACPTPLGGGMGGGTPPT